MISPTRFYEIYVAISLHFKENSSYDFFKYKGQTKVNKHSLMKRNDNYFFKKQAFKSTDEREAIKYLFANYLNGNTYINSMNEDCYLELQSYADGLYYHFEQDLTRYQHVDPINACYTGSKAPLVYLAILNEITNGKILELYDQKYGHDDFLWSDLRDYKIKKISSFISYVFDLTPDKKQKLKSIVKQNT